MSGALETAGTLMAAATEAPTRELKIIYAAESRLQLARALEQLATFERMLDAIEAEIARTSAAAQMTLPEAAGP
jgi:hypothetical protein